MNRSNCCNCLRNPAGADDHCAYCSPLWAAVRKANDRVDASRATVCGIAQAIVEIRAGGRSIELSLENLEKAVAENVAAIHEFSAATARYDRANPRSGGSL